MAYHFKGEDPYVGMPEESWSGESESTSEFTNIPILSDRDFDRLHIPKLLGSGAYGLVQTVNYHGTICAAKHIHSTLLEYVNQQERRRIIENFLCECKCCKAINHPNIVKFYGVHFPPECPSGYRIHNDMPTHIPVMIMELLDKSLNTYIMEERSIDISSDTKNSILLDVATGLNYLHQRDPPIVHRDITPNNILLKSNPSDRKKPWIAKIADLGVAKVIKANSNLKHTRAPGTPDFMPPEALKENPYYTTSLDVFSYGGVALFVATYEWPSPLTTESNNSVSEVERRRRYLEKIAEEMKLLKPLIEDCLSDDPGKRPTMKNVLDKVTEIMKDYVMFDSIKPPSQQHKRGIRRSVSSKDDLALVAGLKRSSASTSRRYTEDDWYVGCISSKEAEKMLKDLFDGTYFIREKKECKKSYEICIKYKKLHHIDIIISHQFSITEEKNFPNINDMINHYQEHSLVHSFPSIDTKLKCPYYVIVDSPHKQMKSPWSIPQSLPPPIAPTPSDSAGRLGIPPEIHHKKKSRFGQIASALWRKQQSHKTPLQEELWYYGEISRHDAVQLLKNDGDCLVRYSRNRERHVMTARCGGEVKHFIITTMFYQGECAYGFHGSEAFSSIAALLTHHIEKQISVPGHNHFYLKQPINKQITFNEQRTISHNNIIFDDKPIEVERSGCIYFATLKHSSERVIIKTCYTRQFNYQQQFLQEANILRQLRHSNIIKLLSVRDDQNPIYMVLQMMQGNFLQFLHELGESSTIYQLTSFLLDAAMGMEYLTSQSYIHRNLCAKSCMIEKDGNVLKIFDFSMCAKVENGLHVMEADEEYYISVKWAAPEVFAPGIYTSACDVWSYGVLMYETYSYGQAPFYGLDDQDVLQKLMKGHRLKPPKCTPKTVSKEVMLLCWDILPKQRPTFKDIVIKLKGILSRLPSR